MATMTRILAAACAAWLVACGGSGSSADDDAAVSEEAARAWAATIQPAMSACDVDALSELVDVEGLAAGAPQGLRDDLELARTTGSEIAKLDPPGFVARMMCRETVDTCAVEHTDVTGGARHVVLRCEGRELAYFEFRLERAREHVRATDRFDCKFGWTSELLAMWYGGTRLLGKRVTREGEPDLEELDRLIAFGRFDAAAAELARVDGEHRDAFPLLWMAAEIAAHGAGGEIDAAVARYRAAVKRPHCVELLQRAIASR